MKGKPQKEVLTGVWYYAVIYLFNDTIHAIPFETEEEARTEGQKWINKITKKLSEDKSCKKCKPEDYVKNFYVVKRNMDKYQNGEVF